MPARRRLVIPDQVDDPYEDLGNLVLALGPDMIEELVGNLSGTQHETIARAVARVSAGGWRATPATMAEHLSGGEYQRWPYVDLLADAFAGAFRGTLNPHQIWNLPSQYGKTTGLTRGIVWALDLDPRLRLMYVSHDADKAVEEGGAARDFAETHAGQLRFRLRRDRRARGMWRTTEGGGLYCTGINGSIVGWPADALLLDDLIKGWQAAHSETQRRTTMNIYRSQIRLRVQSNTNPIIVAGTRWHEDDLSGQLRVEQESNPEADRWHVIRLPAIAEAPDPKNEDRLLREPDPLGRPVGAALEPRRFDVPEVMARRAVLGPYLWAAMEQQRPAPEEGSELMRAWWRWADAPPPRFDDALTSWDMKLKDKTGGDYVVGQAWGRTGSDFWWLDQLRGQWNLVTTKTAIVLMQVRHPDIKKHVIENTGNGPEVMEELRRKQPGYTVSEETRSLLGITDDEVPKVNAIFRRGMPGLVPQNVKLDKIVRARAHTGYLEGGNIHLLYNRPEADQLVNEAAAFPRGAHDDSVDAWSQAIDRLSRTPLTARGAKRRPEQPRPERATAAATAGGGSSVRAMRGRRATPRPRITRRDS